MGTGTKMNLLNRQSLSPGQQSPVGIGGKKPIGNSGIMSANPKTSSNYQKLQTQQILQNNLMYSMKPKANSPNGSGEQSSSGYISNQYQTLGGKGTTHKKQLFSQRDQG